MPRFFFDVDGETPDENGTELRDRQHARNEAMALLPVIAKSLVPAADHRTLVTIVRDQSGKPVFRAMLTLTCQRLD